MPFIELGDEFGETREAVLAPAGKQYDLLCKDVEEYEKEVDGGVKKSLRVLIMIEDPENDFAPFSHFLALPNPTLDQRNDEEKSNPPGTTSKNKMLMIKRFLHAFRVPMTGNGFNPQDIPGARARLALTQDTWNDQLNQRIKLPPLPGEAPQQSSGGSANKKRMGR